MHLPPKPRLSRQRLARILAWTLALLLWLARALDSNKPARRRHLRQRYIFFDLDWLVRHVAVVIVLHAARLAPAPRRRRLVFFHRGRDLKRTGFRRSAFGSRLRRALKGRGDAGRIGALIDALRRIDILAAIYAARLRRRFTRLWPLIAAPDAAAPLPALAGAAVRAADTS
ncbi:hypothetical protein [Terricaulis sp.]|uniref:hypothetical protein n=1 Tax=Terricaulis sp. TaxID=2768686 RepID=UPI003783DD78